MVDSNKKTIQHAFYEWCEARKKTIESAGADIKDEGFDMDPYDKMDKYFSIISEERASNKECVEIKIWMAIIICSSELEWEFLAMERNLDALMINHDQLDDTLNLLLSAIAALRSNINFTN